MDDFKKEVNTMLSKEKSQGIGSDIFNKLANVDNIKGLIKVMKEINLTMIDLYRKNRLRYMDYNSKK